MCNACGFYCCASDELGKCGCEHCPDPACWWDEEDDDLSAEEEFDLEEAARLECAGHAHAKAKGA
jgi:hypothetical protein